MNVQRHWSHLSGTVKVMIDEAAFRQAADRALESLFKSLTRAGDSFDFEADMNNGALTVEFEDPPAKFVVSPNTPVRQIWVSAHSKSFKLDWNEAAESFVLSESGETLSRIDGQTHQHAIGRRGRALRKQACLASTFRGLFARKSARTATSRRGYSRGSWRELRREANAAIGSAEWPWTPETVYLGGGTPSQMDVKVLARVLGAVPGRQWVEAT